MVSEIINKASGFAPVHSIRLFKAAIYVWLLANTLFLMPIANDIWGSNSLLLAMEVPEVIRYQFFYLLMYETIANWFWVLIALQISSIVIWFWGKGQRAATILIWLTTIILFLRAYLYVTGGHRLLQMFLFFFIFIDERKTDEKSNIINNFFFLACILQLMLVYFLAGIYKLNGENWLRGDALYYVLSLREFSHPIVQKWFLDKTLLLTTGNYVALGYQVLFPILIWIKPFKWSFLMIGIAFHLMVAIVMGLPDFGILMIFSYTMFISDQKAKKILSFFDSLLINPFVTKKRVV